jgi:hypothetical protein
MTDFDVNSDPAKLPSLPSLDGVTDPAVKKFLQALKEQNEIRFGQRPKVSKMDQALTFRDLYNYGLASFTINGQEVANPNPDSTVNAPGSQTGGSSSSGEDDLLIPGAPVGLEATGTKLSVLIEWTDAESAIAYTEVWRSEVNDLATAVMIGTTPASVYADIINEAGRTFYYWIRFVNRGGIPGPYNDDTGVLATTGQIGSAEIISVDGAKIIDATILSAKIVNISADKIITGVLNATESISVGDSASRIHIMGSGKIRSGGATDYMNGSGFYFDNPDGFGRAFIGNGTYYVAWSGSQLTIEANNFSLTPNSFVFKGSGEFSGALVAATGTFAGALQAATGTFSGELIAATGTFAGNLMAGVLDFSQLDGVRSTYLTPGSYTITVPVGKTTMRASLCGGSGGGGGAGNVNGSGGGGGGSTGLYVATFTGLTPGATYTLIIGARGVRGDRAPYSGNFTNYGTAGTDGGDTSIVGLMIAYGGKGGARGGPLTTGSIPGGNAGTNGQRGGDGSGARWATGTPGAGDGSGGLGGPAGNSSIKAGNKGGKGGDGPVNANTAEDGINGFATIEFFNPNSVVLQTTYSQLLTKLQQQGIQVP